MNARYSFRMQSEDNARPLPSKIIISQNPTETVQHVLLKLLGFLLFYRERLQMETSLHLDHIPFVPDLIQLDYTLQPKLWVECGECSLVKLDKLAVKVPEAEIWVVKKSPADAEHLLHAMQRQDLRRDRYGLVAFDPEVMEELAGLLRERNHIVWYAGRFNPPQMQFDFNALWFDASFTLYRH